MKKETPKYVEFAVTARKYTTLLTRNYINRKFWIEPNPYDIQSFIPGTVIQIFVKEGEVVEEGAPLLILQAMKMRNRIEMPFTARIKKINITVGKIIPKETIMIELELIEED